jgi:PQQ-dependent catabolism-associated CXXCW motif protein
MNTHLRAVVQRFLLVCLSSFGLLSSAAPLAGGQTLFFSSDGYRIDRFRDQVPDGVPGARTIHTAELRQLTESAATRPLLIDVLPSPPRPANLAPNALWLPPVRRNIPGSVWLPNVGYGRLSDDLEGYFRGNLGRLTGKDPARILVIYCLADCWMSWNAARRAAEYGYRRVYWYPEGTDGWERAGLPLVAATPIPMR